MTGHQKLDRSISGPLSVTAAAADMMDDNEEGETGLAQPTSLASEDVEGLSGSEVVTLFTPGLDPVDIILLLVARRVVCAVLFYHCFACTSAPSHDLAKSVEVICVEGWGEANM